jgi:hypothetical protein
MTIYEYRQIIVPASILIPICIAISRFRKMPAYATCLLIYLVISAIVNTTAIAIIHVWKGKNNLWLLHIYTILESFLLLYYFKLIIINKSVNSTIRVLLWAFPLFCIVNFLFLQSIRNFNTYTRPVEAIIFIALCAIYWWQDNKEDTEKPWRDIPNNWMVTGLMLYFSGGFFLFLLAKYIMTGVANKKAWDLVWDAHATLVLIMYLLMAVGFMKCKK